MGTRETPRRSASAVRLAAADDAALASSLRRHDPAALAEAIRRHASSVAAVARMVMGDQAPADDIVEDVFLQLWARPERYDPDRGALGTFLRVDARCRTLDMARRDTSRHRRARAGRPDTGGDPADIVADRPDPRAMRRALDSLSGRERAVIELALFAGHTYRQIAEILELPEGTVKSRIRSGLRRLRSALDAPTPPPTAQVAIVAAIRATSGTRRDMRPIPVSE